MAIYSKVSQTPQTARTLKKSYPKQLPVNNSIAELFSDEEERAKQKDKHLNKTQPIKDK